MTAITTNKSLIRDLITDQANYVLNSGFRVDWNDDLPWVAIHDTEENDDTFYFQEHDAEEYLGMARRVEDETGVDFETALLARAKPYIDALSGD